MTLKSKGKLSALFSSKKLNVLQIIIIILSLTAVFIFVYSLHFSSPFPSHMDEWHSIEKAIELEKGTYTLGTLSSLEIGFSLFLLIIGKITNLILFYQFLPAIWAVITAIILFFIVYNLTDHNFLVSFASIIFFGSIKSNDNLTGLWFFTPLTFAIPFIFLYIFFFVKGLQKHNRNYILLSLGIMIFLVFFHAISVLFAVPILIISSLFYIKFVKKEYRTFLLFFIVPIIGLFFYSLVIKTNLIQSFVGSINLIQFGKYWAGSDVPVFNNYFTEIYSVIGYILAIIGSLFIIIKKRKDLSLYVIWPFYLLISILFFKLTGMSYFSPYQRNMYYFAISLPLLSALGLNYFFEVLSKKLNKRKVRGIILISLFIIIIFFTYTSYYSRPGSGVQPYVIRILPEDYRDLSYLSNFSYGKILAPPIIVPIIEPISGKKPLGDYFDGSSSSISEDINLFYNTNSCAVKDSIISKYNITYVMTGEQLINCNYNIILSNNHDTIYSVK